MCSSRLISTTAVMMVSMVSIMSSAIIVLIVLTSGSDAYSVAAKNSRHLTRWLQMNGNNEPPRSVAESFSRPFLQRGVQSVLALTSAALLRPAPAFAGRLENVNEKLTGYGLPPILFVPPGFMPLVSEYGRGNIKEAMTNPILIQFSHPALWVEVRMQGGVRRGGGCVPSSTCLTFPLIPPHHVTLASPLPTRPPRRSTTTARRAR